MDINKLYDSYCYIVKAQQRNPAHLSVEDIKEGLDLEPLYSRGDYHGLCLVPIHTSKIKKKKGRKHKMKVLYVCEKCGKKFETEELAIACETKHTEKAERQKEIDKLVSSFYEDYGSFPTMTLSAGDIVAGTATIEDALNTSISAWRDILKALLF